MATNNRFNVFISAASAEFWADQETYRDAVARDLRRAGYFVFFQEEFTQGDATLLAKLHGYIQQCSVVILLVGNVAGSFPTQAQVDALPPVKSYAEYGDHVKHELGKHESSGENSLASYTQWEYFFAKECNCKIYVFFTTKDFVPTENPNAIGRLAGLRENPYDAASQRAFRAWIRREGKDRGLLTTKGALVEELRRIRSVQAWPAGNTSTFDEPEKRPFVGRASYLEILNKKRVAATEERAWMRLVVTGLGGVGKTRLAVEYCREYRGDFPTVRLIAGESRESLQDSLASLSTRAASPLVVDAGWQGNAIDKTLRWFRENPGWLLIVDNVDSQEAQEAFMELLPQLTTGHILITGRWTKWSSAIDQVNLDLLDARDCETFLDQGTPKRSRMADPVKERAEARQIATDVDRLSLVLEQAAAFINNQGITFEKYRQRWAANSTDVLSEQAKLGISRSALTTWRTTYDVLGPDARELLNMLSWLAPDPLPWGLLNDDGWLDEIERASGSRPKHVEYCMATLRDYSMVQHSTEANSAGQLHRIMLEVIRHHLPEDKRVLSLKAVLRAVDRNTPQDANDDSTWDTFESISPHLAMLIANARQAGVAKDAERFAVVLGAHNRRKQQRFGKGFHSLDYAKGKGLWIGLLLCASGLATLLGSWSGFCLPQLHPLLRGMAAIPVFICYLAIVCSGLGWFKAGDVELRLWRTWLVSAKFKPPDLFTLTLMGIYIAFWATSVVWLPLTAVLMFVFTYFADNYLWRLRDTEVGKMTDQATEEVSRDRSLSDSQRDAHLRAIQLIRVFFSFKEQRPRLQLLTYLCILFVPLAAVSAYWWNVQPLRWSAYVILVALIAWGEQVIWRKRFVLYRQLDELSRKRFVDRVVSA